MAPNVRRTCRLLLLAAAAMAVASPARADEGAPPGTPSAPPPPSVDPPAGAPPAPAAPAPDDSWVDAGHSFVEQRIFAPVLRLDRFFSDERDIEHERAKSFLRWRSEVRFEEARGTRPAFTTGVRANLRLPGLNRQLRRLRLVIEGQTRDAISALMPGEEGEPPPEEEVGTGDAGLRFALWDTVVSHADLGGGILFRLPPGVFGRLRFRWAVPLGRRVLGRVAVSGFYRSDTEFGSSLSLEVERPISPMLVGRVGGSGTLTELSPGVEWGTEVALLAALGPRAGAHVGAAMSGATRGEIGIVDPATGLTHLRPTPGIGRYRLFARLRRDVYRRWLFLEIEPDVSWPWAPEVGREPTTSVVLRLEVQFHGNEAPPPAPEPPRPRGPEPQDPPDPSQPEAREPRDPPLPGPQHRPDPPPPEPPAPSKPGPAARDEPPPSYGG